MDGTGWCMVGAWMGGGIDGSVGMDGYRDRWLAGWMDDG